MAKDDDVNELLKNIEPRLRRAFELGISNIQSSDAMKQIEDAIRAGDTVAATTLITETLVGTAFIEFKRELQKTVEIGGDLASRWARADKIVFGMNVTDSNTARFIRTYQADKIREITVDIQQTVGEIVRLGTNDGINPKDVARQVRENVGLTMHQQQTVRNYEQLLRDRKKDALNRALRDKRFDRTVATSIESGRPLSEDRIKQMGNRYRERMLIRRSQTIARTEAIRLVSRGQLDFWEQAVSDGVVERSRLRKKWINTADGKVREAHQTLPRMNPPEGVLFDEPFQSELGPIHHPGDPTAAAANVVNCRCAMFIRVEV